MYKSVTIVLAAIVVSLLAVACGTETVTSEPVTPADGGTSPAKATAGVGDTLKIAGNDSELEVTLTKTKRLPAAKAYGMEIHPALYGTQLTVKNVGNKVYDDSISNCVVLVDTKDQSHNAEIAVSDESGNTLAGTLESVKIAPGDKRSGWVFFALKPKTKARTLQFTADSGFGPEVGEWSLR